jgi:hypothetical protein
MSPLWVERQISSDGVQLAIAVIAARQKKAIPAVFATAASLAGWRRHFFMAGYSRHPGGWLCAARLKFSDII